MARSQNNVASYGKVVVVVCYVQTKDLTGCWREAGRSLVPRCSLIGPDLCPLHHCPGESWVLFLPKHLVVVILTIHTTPHHTIAIEI